MFAYTCIWFYDDPSDVHCSLEGAVQRKAPQPTLRYPCGVTCLNLEYRVRTRSPQGAVGLSQVLAGDNGLDRNHLGRLARFNSAIGAVLLGFGIFLLHRQVERRIDQIGKL